MSACQDLVELSRHLKQERLFVVAEKEHLAFLNEDVGKSAENFYHISWIMRQQRMTLDQLILGQYGTTPAICLHRINALESVNFVDSYRHLSYHDTKAGDFLKNLRENAKLVALCLCQGEQIQSTDNMQSVTRIIMNSVYGNCVIPEDEYYVLQILKSLIDLQLACHDNPRGLLRKGSCTFSIVFKLLCESMFSAKLFLTASLHQPVMQLLMEDEWFYDIDPERALYRFPPQERIRRFGQTNSAEYNQKIREYRELTTSKLVMLAERFITSIKSNMFCFPQNLSWLIMQMYQIVTKAGRVNIAEARAMCTDLVFALFICPAICDPEPYGITTDAPISYIARHNLMQVAQILQVLAISKWDEIDPKCKDLYGQFEKGCVSSLLDMILESALTEQPPQQSSQLPGVMRASVLITLSELHKMVEFLQTVRSHMSGNRDESQSLADLLALSPPLPPLSTASPAKVNHTPGHTPPTTPSSAKKHIKGKEKKLNNNLVVEDDQLVPSIDAAVSAPLPDEVLVISLNTATECPGMQSEQKILSEEFAIRQRQVKYNNYIPGEDASVSDLEIPLQEKRTRFSLSHDQDSIATSDIPEAISEAASSHSVGSDLEENENDNLSDMMSANVSGRGTPSISGRDTPVSQAESQIEVQEERRAPDLPVTVQKTNREDVTERFGKFEIKSEIEKDDIKSTVSDTWSTDVLASDSEPPEQNQMDRLEEVAEEMARHSLLGVQEVSEVSETASDAWSTDVLASDTSERQADRLLELDQDDVSSVRSHGQEEADMLEASERPDEGAQAAGCDSENKDRNNSGDNSNSEDDAFMPASASFKANSKQQVSGSASDRVTSRKLDMDKDFGQQRHRTVSDIVGHFHKIQPQDKHHSESQQANLLQTFDPFSTYTQNISKLSDDSAVSTDLCSGNENILDLSVSLGEETNFRRQQAGVETESLERFKITEQQNLRLTANRLSITTPLFDPLEDISMRRTARSMSESYVSQNTPILQLPTSRSTYHAQGARPKVVTPSGVPDVPVQEAEESTSVFSLERSSLKDSGVSVSCSNDDAITPTNANINSPPSIMDPEKAAQIKQMAAPPAVEDNVMEDSNHSVSSMDSSTSSVLDSPHVTPESRTQHNGSHNTQPQMEPVDDDKKNDSSLKKKPSFFSSFREKLTIGVNRRSKTKEKEGNRFFSFPFDSEIGNQAERKEHTEGLPRVDSYEEFKDKVNETSDDILAKYRKRANSNLPSTNTYEANGRNTVTSSDSGASLQKDNNSSSSKDLLDEALLPAYNPENLEKCKAFVDAKRKLRMVLSTADIQTLPWLSSSIGGGRYVDSSKRENDLVAFLKVQLAEAMNLQDKHLVAQLHETLRCLRQFDNQEIKKILKSMKEDYRGRSAYVAYLVRCRQGLLCTQAHLERLLNQVQRDKQICGKYFIAVCVRMFIERRERQLNSFISDFQRVTMPDEKTALVESFLNFLKKQMQDDKMWHGASEAQLQDAFLFIERTMMSHVYTHALYPNGDGDIMRDKILHDHMKKLSCVITPHHKDLCIPAVYHYECPWPAAQAEIFMINAYKTPKDKLMCVLRCSSTIMNLLSMANERSVPAADDFMPVLIFVLIKANPLSLLSTVQYVDSFYGKRLQGEEQYWWMQFSSAIEFIKTMDYGE